MIDVWCCLWGKKYHAAYVYALEEAVEQHLTVPHRFRCLSDRELPGIDVTLRQRKWPSWWGKLELFEVASGPSLYFDVDVLLVGNIDYLADYTAHEFAAPANWARSGHGGIQSSVMAWDGSWREPVERFSPADQERLWGDQELLWEIRGDDWVRVPGVYSFKYHCLGGLRGDEKVVVFHGKPDPHEAGLWTWPYTRTLRSLISDTTQHGFERALQNMESARASRHELTNPQMSTSSVGLGTPSGTG